MPLSSTGSPRYGPRYRGGSRGPSFRRERRGPSRALVVFVLVVLVAVGGAVAFVLHQRAAQRERERLQAAAVEVSTAYLAAWSRGDAAAAAALVTPAQRAAAQALLAKTRTDLHAVATAYTTAGPVLSTGAAPGVGFAAKVTVRGLGDAVWTGRVPLVREGPGWAVSFAPGVINPSLPAGGRFAYARTAPTRGKVLMADGSSMAIAGGQLGIDDPGSVRGQVTTLASDADAAKIGPLFVKGDDAGTSGLQAAFNGPLQGTPGGSLAIVDAKGTKLGEPLLQKAKVDGKSVTTTFDAKAQKAAQQALAGAAFPGKSMVVLDAKTGGLLAAVNPSLSLAGTYAPGSTFKVVTTVAALANGVGAGETLNCSKTATVNGRTVKNAEGEAFGPLGFATAFAKSCNTWFAQLPAAIPGGKGIDALTKAAELFGFATGGPTGDSKAAQAAARGLLPIPSFGGSFPRPKDGAQAAGQSFGQDLVLASPLQMAGVAAGVASGTWHKPRVTLTTPDVAHPLPAGTAATVRGFMAGVVSAGGTAGKVGFPGGVIGKTGTAEVSGAKDNSWFIGIRGDVAVACEVTSGGFGADVAAPAVSRFFAAYTR